MFQNLFLHNRDSLLFCVSTLISTSMSSTSDLYGQSLFSWKWLVHFRRTLHMYPEPSFEEYVTAALVQKILVNDAAIEPSQIRCHLGKDDKTKPGTGIIVDIMGEGDVIEGCNKKRLIMFRADLDALRMQEENTNDQIPYRSIRDNCAHMCGHDGHVAALIGLAIVLNKSTFKRLIPSNIGARLIFQPAEEYIGGAEPMIKLANCLQDVEEVYGWHNWPLVDLGTVLLKEGAVMAHETEFYITIRGKGGHASAPDKCIDPIVCASNIVMSLQTIISRFLPSSTNAVISVTQFHCGPLNLESLKNCESKKNEKDESKDRMESLLKNSATNIISDICYLSGTIRDCDREKTFLDIVKYMRQIVACTSESYQCIGELEIVEQYMETRNSKDCVAIVEKCVNKSMFTSPRPGNSNQNERADAIMFPTNINKVTTDGLPLMGSEDFAYYLKERPGCFVIVGTKEDCFKNLTKFDFDKGEAIRSLNDGIETHNSEKHSIISEKAEQKRQKIFESDQKEDSHKNSRHNPDNNTPFYEQLDSYAKKRSNCCAHGSTFDFNDNVLPSIISLFLNIASDRLIEDNLKQKLFKESLVISEEGIYLNKS